MTSLPSTAEKPDQTRFYRIVFIFSVGDFWSCLHCKRYPEDGLLSHRTQLIKGVSLVDFLLREGNVMIKHGIKPVTSGHRPSRLVIHYALTLSS